MRSQGVDLDRDVLDRAVDFGSGVYNWAGGVFEIGSGISIILVVMILGSVGFLLYNIGKDPDTAVRAGSAIATRGMSEVAAPKK